MADYNKAVFKYYAFNNGNSVAVELDPQDGSEWPYHFIVYADFDSTTNTWKLSRCVRQDMGIEKATVQEAIDEVLYQLVSLNRGGSGM